VTEHNKQVAISQTAPHTDLAASWLIVLLCYNSGVTRICLGLGGGFTPGIFLESTNSVEDTGQRKRESEGVDS
jgi:hypothetical protein